jgi:hypothetical protein
MIMFKYTPVLLALIVCIVFTANAQTDTTHYDLGRISVKKGFTQTITIKGSDLEKYQFSDLAEAINVWLYGTYTNSSSLIYVVDGNIINDVNAYSIYDIDEITLVQNALPQVSGASPARQMVLIKLHTGGPGKQGIEAAGQSSLVNIRNRDNTTGVKSSTSLYDQYYLSGYKNFENAHIGLSADYQRDVFPQLTGSNYNSFTPFHFNRLKLNGRADAKVWKGSTLTFGINYTPQVSNYSYNYNSIVIIQDESEVNYSNSHVSQHLFNSNIALRSQIARGLTNTLSGAYNHYNYFENVTTGFQFTSAGNPPVTENEFALTFIKTSNLLIRDNLAYHKKLGVFDFEPSVNFSYRNVHNALSDSVFIIGGNGSNSVSYSSSRYAGKYKTYLLSPSLDIYYSDIFNIQGGFVSILNADKDFIPGYQKHRIFPFLSTSVAIVKPSGSSDISLRVFASFSRQNQQLADEYAGLSGFSLSANSFPGNSSGFFNNGNRSNLYPYYYYFDPYQAYNNYQAGALLGLFKNFTISYSFEYRYYFTYGGATVPYGANLSEFVEIPFNDKTITSRIGFNYNFYSGGFNWNTGLNFSDSKLQTADSHTFSSVYNSGYLSSGHRWSGGFTNRLSYKTFFAGLDVLYQLGQRPYSLMYEIPWMTNYVAPSNTNSFSLQNLYVGRALKITGVKYAEVFANGRNIFQNKTSDITDNRSFFGFGFKLGL